MTEPWKFPPTLSCLEDVARAFIHNMDRYMKYYEGTGDLPYYYNERASLSLLATAFAKCDWLVMEEFTSSKTDGHQNGDARGGIYRGRTDLWVAQENGDLDLLIEAKQCFFPPKARDRLPAAFILSSFADARCNLDGTSQRVAVTFLVPSMPPTASRGELVSVADVATEVEAVLTLLTAEPQNTAMPATHGVICWFPEKARRIEGDLGGTIGKRCWPGVIVSFQFIDSDHTPLSLDDVRFLIPAPKAG